MKHTVSILLLSCLLLATVLGILPVSAVEGRLSTDKTIYAVGEPILVTATGEGKDWVGLYKAEDSYDPSAGGQVSIYWYYVADGGNISGTAKNIYDAEYNNFADRPAFASGIPAGNYKVVLMANDGYAVIEEIAITIEKSAQGGIPDAPLSAVYESANAGAGRADGTVTVRHGGEAPEAYVLRWGNANGAIDGYSDVATLPCAGEETVYSMTPHTLIPAAADRILVFAVNGQTESESAAVANLPSNADTADWGELRYEFQVMSDIHINASDTHIHNQHFAAALADIRRLSPESVGIFINGDIADHGQADEYAAYNRLLQAAGMLPPVYAGIGNHDLGGGGTDAEKIAAFLAATGNDSQKPYFEKKVAGARFLFLGSESVGTEANLSRQQLEWLNDALENESDGPVYLFLHQGIRDTVAGTFTYQGWHGVLQEDRLKQILADHSEVILFSGHSHWMMESKQSFLPATETFPSVLNTASVGYLWNDACEESDPGIVGSQGYYIYVYEHGIVFKGRDFVNEEWISSAQFFLPLAAEHEENESETESESEIESLTASETDSDSLDSTPDTDHETTGDSVVDTLIDSPEISDTDAPAAEADGCSSLLSVGIIGLLFPIAVGLCLGRRKRLL